MDDKQQSAVVKKITLLVSQDRVTDADKPSDKENQTEIFRYLDIFPNQFWYEQPGTAQKKQFTKHSFWHLNMERLNYVSQIICKVLGECM